MADGANVDADVENGAGVDDDITLGGVEVDGEGVTDGEGIADEGDSENVTSTKTELEEGVADDV